MGGNDFGMGYGMGFGGFFMWVFWFALIVLVVWAVISVLGNRGGSRRQSEKSALEILSAGTLSAITLPLRERRNRTR